MKTVAIKDIALFTKCVAIANNVAVFDVDIYLNGSFPYCSNDKIGEANIILNFVTKDVSLTTKMFGYEFDSMEDITLYISKECEERCLPILNQTETKTEQV